MVIVSVRLVRKVDFWFVCGGKAALHVKSKCSPFWLIITSKILVKIINTDRSTEGRHFAQLQKELGGHGHILLPHAMSLNWLITTN